MNWLTVRLSGLTISLILTLAPLARLWWHGEYLLFHVGEFVVYRLGNALALLHGEPEIVGPVQGFTNALVSLAVTAALLPSWDREIGTMAGVNAYAWATLWLLMLPIPAALVWAWIDQRFETSDAVAVSTVAALPWLIGDFSLGLIAAPEYWLVEAGYALLTLAWALWLLRRGMPLGWRGCLLVGGWGAVGLLTKAPDAAAALVVLAVAPPVRWRDWLLLPVAGALTVTLALLAYALGSADRAVAMGQFWLSFLIHPNQSGTVNRNVLDLLYAARTMPYNLAAIMVAVIVAVGTRVPRRIIVAVLVWLAPFAYLVIGRPHDTSAISFTLTAIVAVALLLMAAPCRLTRQRIALGLVVTLAVLVLLIGNDRARGVRSWLAGVPQQQQTAAVFDQITQTVRDAGPVMWYLPGHQWAGNHPISMLLWSGNLGLLPVTLEHNQPTYHPRGQTARWLYGEVVLIGSSNQRDTILTAYRHGTPVLVALGGPLDASEDGDWLRREILAHGHVEQTWVYQAGRSNMTVVLVRHHADDESVIQP